MALLGLHNLSIAKSLLPNEFYDLPLEFARCLVEIPTWQISDELVPALTEVTQAFDEPPVKYLEGACDYTWTEYKLTVGM